MRTINFLCVEREWRFDLDFLCSADFVPHRVCIVRKVIECCIINICFIIINHLLRHRIWKSCGRSLWFIRFVHLICFTTFFAFAFACDYNNHVFPCISFSLALMCELQNCSCIVIINVSGVAKKIFLHIFFV